MGKVFGYTRVSTVANADGVSLDNQREHIMRWFETVLQPKGHTWGGLFEEGGVSGAMPFADRPMGRLANLALEQGDIIIFPKLDRGFRNTVDMLRTVEAWKHRGITVRFLDLDVDSSTATGELILTNMAGVAQFERRRLSERKRECNEELRRQGLYTNGKAPLGFKRVRRKNGYALEPNLEEQAMGAKLLRWYCEGMPIEHIFCHLRANKVANKRTGKEFARAAIYTLIRRALAAGNWVEQPPPKKEGERDDKQGT